MNADFANKLLSPSLAKIICLRQLAYLGDAVFSLFERQYWITKVPTVKQMHEKVSCRQQAETQSKLLIKIMPELLEEEQDIIRRAKNMHVSGYKRACQRTYRQAQSFEALLGYLYLTNPERLQYLIDKTL